jgi:hypothetical protein
MEKKSEPYYAYHNTRTHKICTVISTCKKVTHCFHTLRVGLSRGDSQHKEYDSLTGWNWPGTTSFLFGNTERNHQKLIIPL